MLSHTAPLESQKREPQRKADCQRRTLILSPTIPEQARMFVL
jgi:hypothetical protein